MKTILDVLDTLYLFVVGIFGGIKAVDRIIMKRKLRNLMNKSDGPEDLVESFKRAGCTAIKLSRGRTLLTTPGGVKILVTTEAVVINPTEKSFTL